MKTEISPEINDDEILARGIVHPLMYSKSKKRLKENAFKPPPNRNDVSILRLKYTTADFCKNHFKTLVVGAHQYCGIALIKVIDVRNTSDAISLAFTPLDLTGDLIKKRPVFNDDKGLPMHADIVYDFAPQEGVPAPIFVRKIARELTKQPPAKFFEDMQPEEKNWKGELIL